jgi:hypothetical protein
MTHRSSNVSFRSRADQVADREGEKVPIAVIVAPSATCGRLHQWLLAAVSGGTAIGCPQHLGTLETTHWSGACRADVVRVAAIREGAGLLRCVITELGQSLFKC